MGLKNAYRDAIEQYRSRLCSEFKVRHMLPDLIGIITHEESDDLANIRQDKALNSEFIRILRTRTDADFEKFCELLNDSDSNAARVLGRDLREATRSANLINPVNPTREQSPFGEIIPIDPSASGPPKRAADDQGNIIINHIGTDWRKLAINLDMTINLEVIEREHRTEYERAHAMLQIFYRKHPTNFTLSVFSAALIAIERRDIIEMIAPK